MDENLNGLVLGYKCESFNISKERKIIHKENAFLRWAVACKVKR